MVKKLFLILLLSATHCFSAKYQTPLQMPSQETLEELFYAMDERYFVEETDLIKRLADKELKINNLVILTECAIYDVAKFFCAHLDNKQENTECRNRKIAMHSLHSKDKIIEALINTNHHATREQAKLEYAEFKKKVEEYKKIMEEGELQDRMSTP